MNNCLNVPGELIKAMVTMTWQHMEPNCRKKISGTEWLIPKQAGPTWQVLVSWCEQISVCQDSPRSNVSVESLLQY